MRLLKIFLILLCIFGFYGFVNAADTLTLTWEVEKRFVDSVGKIISLNKQIQRTPKNILLEEIFKRRNTYTRYAQSLKQNMEMNSKLVATVDVSNRYKLSLQKYLLSCEIAALRMVVEAVSGKYVSEEIIIREIPHYAWPLKEGIWWDPEKEFVGVYTWSQAKATWYGVYGFPLSRFLDRKWYDNEYRNTLIGRVFDPNSELSYIFTSLEKWDHVIFWADWCTTPAFDDGIVDKVDMYIIKTFGIAARNLCERNSNERRLSWKTQDNQTIAGLSWEHAYVLLWYVGDKSNPTHIIVWDTDTGKHIYPILEWIRKWSLLEYRTLIVKDNSISRNKK